MKFSLFIAKRYLFTKNSNNAINIITIIAAVGVFAGAFCLFIVLSGFSGLRDFSLSFTNQFDPDLKVLPASGKQLEISEKSLEKISKIEGIQAYSKVIEERVFLDYRKKNHTAFIKGVDANYRQVTQMDSTIHYGTWLAKTEPQVVIGSGISNSLGIGVFDYRNLLKILVPKPGKGQIVNPNEAFSQKEVMVSGIYNVSEDLNAKYVFSSINFAQSLLNLPPNVFTGIEIKLKPDANIQAISQNLNAALGQQLNIKTRAQLNGTLYKMLNTENLAVYLIFTLVLIIALFNVVGSIIMVILDKKENMKTLFSLGATPKQIQNIFFAQGMLLTVLGGVLGLACSILLIFLQLQYSLVMITPSLAYPVTLKFENILIVALTISVLGFIASYIAAGRSKKALAA